MTHAYLLKGITLIDEGCAQAEACLVVEDGMVSFAGPVEEAGAYAHLPVLEAPGWYAMPGFIDIQFNGGYGHDFTNEPDSLAAVAARLPETGVTAFLPTFITSPLERYPAMLEAVRSAQDAAARGEASGARILGAHIEGPFLNPDSRGAHDASLFVEATPEALAYFTPLEAVRLVTLAVEKSSGMKAARWLQEQGVTVAIGHSRASADEAQEAFKAGVKLVTHLYNAMPPLHHREPGLIGAVLGSGQVKAGLIADGVHAHLLMLHLAYRCLGSRGIVLVTDAMGAMGMPPGEYNVGDQTVFVDDTSARLASGTLAGSILMMDEAIRNMLIFGICSLPEAVRMATLSAAEAIGMENELGRLQAGYPADFVLMDRELRVQATFIDGKPAYTRMAGGEVWEGAKAPKTDEAR